MTGPRAVTDNRAARGDRAIALIPRIPHRWKLSGGNDWFAAIQGVSMVT
jgi:hypothetical protein